MIFFACVPAGFDAFPHRPNHLMLSPDPAAALANLLGSPAPQEQRMIRIKICGITNLADAKAAHRRWR